MFTSVSRLILSGGASSTPGGGDEVGAQLLQGLAEMLLPLDGPRRERRRLHERDHLADAVLAERLHRGGDRALVAHELRGVDEHGRDVALAPVLLAGRVGRGEVVERDVRRLVDEDVRRRRGCRG